MPIFSDVIMTRPLWVQSVHFDECRLSAKRSQPSDQVNWLGLGCQSPCRLLSSTPTVAIYYCYSAQMQTLILPSHKR